MFLGEQMKQVRVFTDKEQLEAYENKLKNDLPNLSL